MKENLEINDNDENLNLSTNGKLNNGNFINYKENDLNRGMIEESKQMSQKQKLKNNNTYMDFLQNFEEYKDDKKLKDIKESTQLHSKFTLKFENFDEKFDEKELIETNFMEKLASFLRNIIASYWFSLFATISVISILFLEDIKILFINKKWDHYVDTFILIIIIFIFLEVILFIIFIRTYRFSFFFWLDIISCLSLIPNILHLFKEDQNLEYYEQSYDSK